MNCQNPQDTDKCFRTYVPLDGKGPTQTNICVFRLSQKVHGLER